MKKITKKDFVEKISKTCKLSKRDSSIVFDTIILFMKDAISQDHEIGLSGIGVITKSIRTQRNGRNPKTGENLIIPERRTIKLVPSRKIKEMLTSS